MKYLRHLTIAALALVFPVALIAQDAVKTDPAHYKVVLDNASIRILKISYGPGEKSIMHAHPDGIVIPLVAAKTRFTMPDGKTQDSDLAAESALYMAAGTHNPSNAGTTRSDSLLIEFKTAAPGKAVLPTSRPNMAMKVLAEGPRAMAYRTTATPTFEEPAGTKHDYDQVVIALGTAQMSLSIDGQPTRTTWARGDAVFIPRGVGHAAKNASGKPVDFIIVAIK